MRKRIYLFISLMSLPATTASALDGEYWTYNGFGPIVNAFQFIALIFGTNDYKALFFSVIVAGILFGGIAAYYKLLSSSGGGSTLSWVWPVGLGVMLYIAFFIPKGNLTIYDKVLNRFDTIGGIPDGLIVTASALNTIERGIVQMIQDSGQPLSFYDSAGGVGFNALLKISDPLIAIGAKSKISNAQNFINDCVLFEMQRPGTTLTADVINQTDQKFIDLFGAAQNNAVLTAWTMSDGTLSNNVTCAEAYGYLKTEWSAAATAQDINGICASQGFDINNAGEMTRCKEIVGQTITVAMGAGGMDATQFFAQTSLASVLRASTVGGNLDGAIVKQADVNTKTGMMSVGLVANEYLPVLRAVVTAIAIGMVPFIVIFLPTPLGTKAIGFVVGFFVWLTAWGITDAITHQMAIDYANAYFGQARQNNIGYAAMLTIPDAASRTLGLFGMIRTSGLMLATIITTMLLRFGGHVMGQMAGQLQGNIQGAGSRASGIATAEGTAGKVNQYSGAVATMANAGRFSMGQESTAREYSSGISTQDSLSQISHLGSGSGGHGNISQAVSRSGDAQAIDKASRTMSTLKSADALGGPHSFISQESTMTGSNRVGDIQATRRNAGALGLGNDFAGLASLRRLRENGLTDERSSAAANKALGFSDGTGPVRPGMHMSWSAGDDGQLMVNRVDWQHGNEAGSISGGAMTKTGTWGSGGEGIYRAVQTAMRADDNSHGNFSRGMAGMIGEKTAVRAERELRQDGKVEEANTMRDFIKNARAHHDFKPGRGITSDEALHFRMVQSMDGKTAEIGVRHGTETSWFDTSSDRQGTTIRRGDDIDRGDHVSLGNTLKLDEGTHIPSQSAAQMALGGNPLLVSQISKSSLNDSERDAQRLAVAAAVADGMGSLIKRTGTSADYSSADGSIGAHIPGTKIGGTASGGYRTSDEYNASLMAQHYNEVLKSAHQDAASQGLNKQGTDAFAADRLKGAVQDEVKFFEKHGKWSYGATGGIARLGKMITGDSRNTESD